MPRYIDADALIDDIRKHSESYFADDFAHEWVDKQPSADVQPIQHGNWIGIDDEPCETFECDRCGFVLEDWIQGAFYNFCPNCGADMRGRAG